MCSLVLEVPRHMGSISLCECRGFQEIAPLAKNAGFDGQGIRALCAQVLGKQLIKAEQQSDWGVEKLSEAQVKYAALDAWVARQIALKLLM